MFKEVKMSELFKNELSEKELEKVVGGAAEAEENKCTLKVGGFVKTQNTFFLWPNSGNNGTASLYTHAVVGEVLDIFTNGNRWVKISISEVSGEKVGWVHEGQIAKVADYEFMLNPNIPAG